MNTRNDHVSDRSGVSIVIRSLNEQDYIGSCLSAIKAQRFDSPVEIILVDSGSDDRTVSIAHTYGCRVIEIERAAFSFGGALNLGISHARYPVIVSLSAHCIPASEKWLDLLVGPILEGLADISFGAHVAGDNARTSEKNYFSSKYSLPRGICRRPIMNNGNSAFLKKIWVTKGFDDTLPAQEDMEFCKWHMRNSGTKLVYENRAVVIHYHNDRNWSLYRRLYKELSVEFYLGEQSFVDLCGFVVTLPATLMKDFIFARKAGVLVSAFKGVIAFRLMHFSAYLHAAISHKRFIGRGE